MENTTGERLCWRAALVSFESATVAYGEQGRMLTTEARIEGEAQTRHEEGVEEAVLVLFWEGSFRLHT